MKFQANLLIVLVASSLVSLSPQAQPGFFGKGRGGPPSYYTNPEARKDMIEVMEKYRTQNESKAMQDAGLTDSEKEATRKVLKESNDARKQMHEKNYQFMQGLRDKTQKSLVSIMGEEKASEFTKSLHNQKRKWRKGGRRKGSRGYGWSCNGESGKGRKNCRPTPPTASAEK